MESPPTYSMFSVVVEQKVATATTIDKRAFYGW